MSKSVVKSPIETPTPEVAVPKVIKSIGLSPGQSPEKSKKVFFDSSKSFYSTKKSSGLSKEKTKSFIEYVSDMYSKLLRIQK